MVRFVIVVLIMCFVMRKFLFRIRKSGLKRRSIIIVSTWCKCRTSDTAKRAFGH